MTSGKVWLDLSATSSSPSSPNQTECTALALKVLGSVLRIFGIIPIFDADLSILSPSDHDRGFSATFPTMNSLHLSLSHSNQIEKISDMDSDDNRVCGLPVAILVDTIILRLTLSISDVELTQPAV